MSLVINSTSIEGVNVNGNKMERVFVNGALVFEDVVKGIINSAKSLDIKQYIDKTYPGKKKVQLTFRGINGPINASNLSGIDVTIINEGEIQGISYSNGSTAPAIRAASPITLINKGWIKAAGGYGGKGANGPNDTKAETKYREIYSWVGCDQNDTRNIWAAYIPGYNRTLITVNGVNKWFYDQKFTGWVTLNGKTVRMKNLKKKNVNCSHWTDFYSLEESYVVYTTRTGGIGGNGGAGQSYGRAPQAGQSGTPSTPAGGYTGGRGGTGGSWGKAGARGANVVSNIGTEGKPAGYAIDGMLNIKTGSSTGNIIGSNK